MMLRAPTNRGGRAGRRGRARLSRFLAGLLAIGVASSAGAQRGDAPALTGLRQAEAALQELIASVEPAVVSISHSPQANAGRPPAPDRLGPLQVNPFPLRNDPFNGMRAIPTGAPPAPSGAGVVIAPEGLVLTQFLAVSPGRRHEITTISGQRLDATIKAADPRSGLAVLQVETDEPLPALPIGEAEELRKGSFVLTLGNPYAILADGQPTASAGRVTNLGRRVGGEVNLNNTQSPRLGYRTTLHHFGTLLQTDARLGWNAAGGALINLDGELIGVTTTASTIAGHEQPAGYAIPLNKTFRRVVQTLSEGREVEYGMLGIEFNPSGAVDGLGVQVTKAIPGGPAARAGLRPRDLITEIDGALIRTAEDLQLAVGSLPPDTPTPVRFRRDGKPQTTRVSLAKYYVVGKKVVTNKPPAWRGVRVDHPTALPPEQLLASAQRGEIDPRGCVVVSEVVPDSPSWKNGLRPGMFVTHVGGQRVSTPGEFRRAVENADGSVKLRYVGGPAGQQP